jgi:hypothetical protein
VYKILQSQVCKKIISKSVEKHFEKMNCIRMHLILRVISVFIAFNKIFDFQQTPMTQFAISWEAF